MRQLTLSQSLNKIYCQGNQREKRQLLKNSGSWKKAHAFVLLVITISDNYFDCNKVSKNLDTMVKKIPLLQFGWTKIPLCVQLCNAMLPTLPPGGSLFLYPLDRLNSLKCALACGTLGPIDQMLYDFSRRLTAASHHLLEPSFHVRKAELAMWGGFLEKNQGAYFNIPKKLTGM